MLKYSLMQQKVVQVLPEVAFPTLDRPVLGMERAHTAGTSLELGGKH